MDHLLDIINEKVSYQPVSIYTLFMSWMKIQHSTTSSTVFMGIFICVRCNYICDRNRFHIIFNLYKNNVHLFENDSKFNFVHNHILNLILLVSIMIWNHLWKCVLNLLIIFILNWHYFCQFLYVYNYLFIFISFSSLKN